MAFSTCLEKKTPKQSGQNPALWLGRATAAVALHLVHFMDQPLEAIFLTVILSSGSIFLSGVSNSLLRMTMAWFGLNSSFFKRFNAVLALSMFAHWFSGSIRICMLMPFYFFKKSNTISSIIPKTNGDDFAASKNPGGNAPGQT